MAGDLGLVDRAFCRLGGHRLALGLSAAVENRDDGRVKGDAFKRKAAVTRQLGRAVLDRLEAGKERGVQLDRDGAGEDPLGGLVGGEDDVAGLGCDCRCNRGRSGLGGNALGKRHVDDLVDSGDGRAADGHCRD